MPRPLACQFCPTPLDPAQQFAYHVQTLTAGDRHPLVGGRRLPHAAGKPLRCCRGCEGLIASGRYEVRDTSAAARVAGMRMLVSAAVLAGTGTLTLRLGRWLTGGV
jgi:hypothetical protein